MAKDEAKPPLGPEKGTPWGEVTAYGGEEYGAVYEHPQVDIAKIDKMLATDGKAKSLEDALTLPIRGSLWDIVPAKGDTGQAEAVKEMLTRPANAGGLSTPMDLVIAQATSAITYSKAFFEKVFRIRDGRVVLDKIASRPVSTCELARKPRHGGFAGFRQYPFRPGGVIRPTSDDDYIRVSAERAWVYVHGQHRDPMHGVSDMLVPLWAHETKLKVVWLWFLFLENTALPKAVVKNADMAQAQETAKTFARMKGGAALATSTETELEPWESNGRGSEQFREVLRWLDAEMAGSVLAGFLSLTEQSTGSYALSKDQSDFFVKSREAVARELADSLTSYVVADLVKYNYGPGAPVPRFEFTSLIDVDVNQSLTLLQGLVTASDSPLPDAFVYELAERVSSYLDMDPDKMRKAMDEEGKLRKERAEKMAATQEQALRAGQMGQVSGAVNAAAKEVSRDGQRRGRTATGRAA